MNDKMLLTLFATIAVVAFFSLGFVIERRALNPDSNKNWWSIAFVSPADRSLDFLIENHSDSTTFSYSLAQGKQIIETQTLDIPRGSSVTVPVPPQTATGTERTIITVWTNEKNKKEIYK